MQQKAEQPFSVLGFCVWLIAAFFFLYEFFLRTFPGSIAHQLIPDLHLSLDEFSMIGSAYYLVYGLMQLPVGVLADKFGVKAIMVFATLMCAIATYVFAHSSGFESAFFGRLLMGFGSSFAFVCLLVVASTWFPRRLFGFFAGASQFIGTMGPILAGGPLISFLLTAHVSWRVALSGIGSFGIVLAVLTFLFVKNKPRGGEQTLLFLVPRREKFSLRLKRLFKTKQAWVIAMISSLTYSPIAIMAAVWGTDYLQSRGLSEDRAAYMISLAWIAYAIGCPLFGAISDVTKRRKPILILCAALGLISTLLILYGHMEHKWFYAPLFFLLGLAATAQNIGFATITEQASQATRATALGMNNMFILIPSAIIPVVIGAVITHLNSDHQTSATHISVHSFEIGLGIIPLLYGTGLLMCIFALKETYCRGQKDVVVLKAD